MGNRQSSVVTGTGDGRESGLLAEDRVEEDDPVSEMLGTLDELSSFLGLAASQATSPQTRDLLAVVQNDLFDLGAGVNANGREIFSAIHVDRLETYLADLSRDLEPPSEFILPGGAPSGSLVHVARAVCRRAERRLTSLAGLEDQIPLIVRNPLHTPNHRWGITYLNRLHDLLFVVARRENRAAATHDVLRQQDQTFGRPASGDDDPFLC